MIYFIQAGRKGPVKIGYTKNNIRDRLKNLQAATAEKLHLIGVLPGEVRNEKELHVKFKDLNIHGEWYKPETELIQYIYSSIMFNIPYDGKIDMGFSLDNYLESIERSYIERALILTNGRKQKAADLLGLPFRKFRYRTRNIWSKKPFQGRKSSVIARVA